MTQTTDQASAAAARPHDTRKPDQIEADIERTRDQLAGTIDVIADRVHPRRLARRRVEWLRGQLVNERGRPRVGRLAPLAGGVAMLVAFAVWRQQHSSRR
ncbi:MAG: DUF3618 domain-containing protein [Streptomycetales bacterium]